MKLVNSCSIYLDSLEKEHAILVKVPPPEGSKESDKYFYVGNQSVINSLNFCPFTRRNSDFYMIKLADLTDQEFGLLLKPNSTDELIEDKELLGKISTKMKWEKALFPSKVEVKRENTWNTELEEANDEALEELARYIRSRINTPCPSSKTA